MSKCNCKGCKERNVGCHAECVSYQTYVSEREIIRKNRLEGSEYMGYIRACSDKACRIHFGKASY